MNLIMQNFSQKKPRFNTFVSNIVKFLCIHIIFKNILDLWIFVFRVTCTCIRISCSLHASSGFFLFICINLLLYLMIKWINIPHFYRIPDKREKIIILNWLFQKLLKKQSAFNLVLYLFKEDYVQSEATYGSQQVFRCSLNMLQGENYNVYII